MTDWKAQAAKIWDGICDIYGIETGELGDDSQVLAMLEAALERAAALERERCAKIAEAIVMTDWKAQAREMVERYVYGPDVERLVEDVAAALERAAAQDSPARKVRWSGREEPAPNYGG